VPAVVTEEMLSAHDWYTTFAALAVASDKVPTDRPIDGIDASGFLLGESATTGRESILFFGPDGSLMSVKWHNLKVILRYGEGMDQPIATPQWPMLFDLCSDPGELYNVFADKMDMGWMLGVALKFVVDYQKRIAEYPNIKTGDEFEGYPAATSAAGS
jgi:arylsulfatase